MAKSICFVDRYYPDAYAKAQCNYPRPVDACFGTADFYSRAFRSYGWKTQDIILNQVGDAQAADIAKQFDVVYCQDLSWMTPQVKDKLEGKLIAGQCSCPWPGDDVVSRFDIVFTSFPHYLQRIRDLAVNCKFLQIGFGGQYVLERLGSYERKRKYPITFVGGIGAEGKGGWWTGGTNMLNEIAKNFRGKFSWWGYGAQYASPLLKECYRGEAWGLDMYEIYMQSKIVVNRHGEVAKGCSNNMRMFEATGCGALLATEESWNLQDYFQPNEVLIYKESDDLMVNLDWMLTHPVELAERARLGFYRTMRDHTYDRVLIEASEVLENYRE